jgi:CheY-like chemotaxis protein
MATPRVLVVEDDESVRLMLHEGLHRDGFEVVVASNVRDALQLIAKEAFDVLLSDLHMPLAGDGHSRWHWNLRMPRSLKSLTGRGLSILCKREHLNLPVRINEADRPLADEESTCLAGIPFLFRHTASVCLRADSADGGKAGRLPPRQCLAPGHEVE